MRFALLVPSLVALVFGIPIAANWRSVADNAAMRYSGRRHHWYSSPLNRSATGWRVVGAFLVVFGVVGVPQTIFNVH
jgi:hypothetical protein